jgi:hypothetical protein
LLLAVFCFAQKTQAQDHRLNLNLNYSVTQPFGSLHDYAGKTSFNSWNGSLMYDISPSFSAGLTLGFHDYYKKIPRMIYSDKTTDISAVQTHTLQTIPVQATGIYTIHGGRQGVHPYLGLGVGITDVNYEKYWGEFADQDNRVAFSISPMAGLKIPLGQTSPVKLNIGVRYNYVPYSYNEIDNINSLEGNVGISIHFH